MKWAFVSLRASVVSLHKEAQVAAFTWTQVSLVPNRFGTAAIWSGASASNGQEALWY